MKIIEKIDGDKSCHFEWVELEKMKQYLDALKHCYENGSDVVSSRAGKVRKSFGYQMIYLL